MLTFYSCSQDAVPESDALRQIYVHAACVRDDRPRRTVHGALQGRCFATGTWAVFGGFDLNALLAGHVRADERPRFLDVQVLYESAAGRPWERSLADASWARGCRMWDRDIVRECGAGVERMNDLLQAYRESDRADQDTAAERAGQRKRERGQGGAGHLPTTRSPRTVPGPNGDGTAGHGVWHVLSHGESRAGHDAD